MSDEKSTLGDRWTVGVSYTTNANGNIDELLTFATISAADVIVEGYSVNEDFTDLCLGPARSPFLSNAAGSAGRFYPCAGRASIGDCLQLTPAASPAVVTLWCRRIPQT